ncbi:MAG: acyltransferase [Polyangiales bacterium]
MGPRTADHAPALDGVRGLAVLLVVVHHWEVWPHAPIDLGLLGVRLFFVLSGFLITNILLQGRDFIDAGETTLGAFAKAFYARRFLRLLPLYYATLAALWAVDASGVRSAILWHAAHGTNLLVARSHRWIGYPSHFWSLSVEEQFYLLWVWVIALTPRRVLPWVLGVVIAAGPAWRAGAMLGGLGRFAALYLLPGCLDALGVGASLAYLHRTRGAWRDHIAHGMAIAGALVFALATLATRGADATTFGRLLAGTKGTAIALLLGAFVRVCTREKGALVQAMSWRPLAWLGRVSYAVYVIHPMAYFGLREHLPSVGGAGARWALASAITLGFAAASWRWFEGPLNAQKSRFPYRPTRAAASTRAA